MRLTVNTEKTYLSSESALYKTERFIKQTHNLAGIDFFLSKIAETVIKNIQNIFVPTLKSNAGSCYAVSTDAGHVINFRLGAQLPKSNTSDKDIVFYKYEDAEGEMRRNDQRLAVFLKAHPVFFIETELTVDAAFQEDFKKLYVLSNADQVNFPLLNARQKEIVFTEDKNVVVQGVAGSGKTNICLNKIVYAACRAYAGKVLYSTFSRGLLLDVKSKVDILKQNILTFIQEHKKGNIVFLDKNYKKAVENKLGLYLTEMDLENLINKVESVAAFLESRVDYCLLEDLYSRYVKKDFDFADEAYFIGEYARNIKNHQLMGKLEKIAYLSKEVIYKEIYGMIKGFYDYASPQPMLDLKRYTELRKESFSTKECEIIHSIAVDYYKHIAEKGFVDNNVIARTLIDRIEQIEGYSLAVIDEAQDMTEVNLVLFKKLALKLFAVGDALQMINPSYFSFAFLKRLLFEKDIISVAELVNNYRNTKKISEIIEELGELNIARFGTHSFVLKGESVDYGMDTAAIIVKGRSFLEALAKRNLDGYTVVVSNVKEKEALRKILKKQEILTVSEIKGLERETVILYNLLSSNLDKWQNLERMFINRKEADENSVYRYYFNLFYVGVSRAKNYLYVAEDKDIAMFNGLFDAHFERKSIGDALFSLENAAKSADEDIEEMLERIRQFTSLDQYDNARHAANKISDDKVRTAELIKIEIYEKHIRHGRYREAGIAYWEQNMLDKAKEQFALSKDDILISLVDACQNNEGRGLDIDILKYLPEVAGNAAAANLIIQTVKNDLNTLSLRQKNLQNKFKLIKEKKNG